MKTSINTNQNMSILAKVGAIPVCSLLETCFAIQQLVIFSVSHAHTFNQMEVCLRHGLIFTMPRRLLVLKIIFQLCDV